VSLPLIAGVLGALFELDNTADKPDKAEERKASAQEPRKRVAAAGSNGKAKPSAAPADEVAPASEERRARR
jgi:hypothetical protein